MGYFYTCLVIRGGISVGSLRGARLGNDGVMADVEDWKSLPLAQNHPKTYDPGGKLKGPKLPPNDKMGPKIGPKLVWGVRGKIGRK